MVVRLTQIWLLLALFACAGWAHKRSIRQTAADGIVEGDFTDDETSDNVYQTVSSSVGNLTSASIYDGWGVTAVNATIELSTNATYAYNYMSGNGTSRFNVTVHLAPASSGTSNNVPQITASILTASCSNASAEDAFLTSNITGAALTRLTIVPSSNSITTAGNQTATTIYEELIEYEDAKSVGLYAGSNFIGCQNLQPPFPDFPNDWSATIETTDKINGTTFVLVEQYSQSMDKIRIDLHSFGANRIVVTDTTTSSVTFINPSNGSCRSRPTRATQWLTSDDNVTLLSTAEVLHFSQDQFSYVPGQYSVRGIQCELWTATVNFTGSWASAYITANFYFPIDQWLVNREDYHRMLKQIELNGTFNGQTMDQVFTYVDFRPRTFVASTFETCAISPYGSGCNCTAALRRKAFANVAGVNETDGDDFSVAGDLDALCDYGHPVPHGFISAQSGPYVGLTIIGMIGGSLITGIAMYLLYRKRAGVSIRDNFGHQKFQDAPGA